MAVMVTGAAGLIGFHLSECLLQQDEQVVGIDNLCTGQADNIAALQAYPGFSWIEADICDPFDVREPISVIFNLACPPSPFDFKPRSLEILATCSTGTHNQLQLALEKSAVFLQASTSECYGDPQVHPQPEDYFGNVNPIGWRSPYDEGKRFAEALVTAFARRHDVPVRIARIFNTYGPRMRTDDGRALPTFIKQALSNQPLTIWGDGTQTRSFCYVSDMTDGLLRLAGTDYTMPVNLGNPDEVSIKQVALEVIELTESKSQLTFVPAKPEDPAVRCPDISLARRLLGWEPLVSRPEGLRKTIESCRARSTSC